MINHNFSRRIKSPISEVRLNMFFGKKGAFSVCSLISKNRCAKAVENSNFIKLRSSDSQKINFKFFNKNSSPKNFSNVNQNSSAKNYSFIFKGSLFTAAVCSDNFIIEKFFLIKKINLVHLVFRYCIFSRCDN